MRPEGSAKGARLSAVKTGLRKSITSGFIGAVAGAILGGLTGRPSLKARMIQGVETLHWSWSKARSAIRSGFQISNLIIIIGLVMGTLFGMIMGKHAVVLEASLLISLGGGLTFGLIRVLLGGFVPGELENKVFPNQGIHRSLRSAVLCGIVLGATGEVIFMLLRNLCQTVCTDRNFTLLFAPMTSALIIVPLSALIYGGYACLSHLALRIILWLSGAMPWNYSRFLDYAAERLLLRKVGGGYVFIHRMVLEYLASLKM